MSLVGDNSSLIEHGSRQVRKGWFSPLLSLAVVVRGHALQSVTPSLSEGIVTCERNPVHLLLFVGTAGIVRPWILQCRYTFDVFSRCEMSQGSIGSLVSSRCKTFESKRRSFHDLIERVSNILIVLSQRDIPRSGKPFSRDAQRYDYSRVWRSDVRIRARVGKSTCLCSSVTFTWCRIHAIGRS